MAVESGWQFIYIYMNCHPDSTAKPSRLHSHPDSIYIYGSSYMSTLNLNLMVSLTDSDLVS